jgi:hypothetical protein
MSKNLTKFESAVRDMLAQEIENGLTDSERVVMMEPFMREVFADSTVDTASADKLQCIKAFWSCNETIVEALKSLAKKKKRDVSQGVFSAKCGFAWTSYAHWDLVVREMRMQVRPSPADAEAYRKWELDCKCIGNRLRSVGNLLNQQMNAQLKAVGAIESKKKAEEAQPESATGNPTVSQETVESPIPAVLPADTNDKLLLIADWLKAGGPEFSGRVFDLVVSQALADKAVWLDGMLAPEVDQMAREAFAAATAEVA